MLSVFRMSSLLFSFKQGVVTNFEIFRMREKQVPVDVVEMKGKCHCPVLWLSGSRAVTHSHASLGVHGPGRLAEVRRLSICYKAYVGSRFLCPSQLQSLSLSSCQVKRRPLFFHSYHVTCLRSRGTRLQAAPRLGE